MRGSFQFTTMRRYVINRKNAKAPLIGRLLTTRLWQFNEDLQVATGSERTFASLFFGEFEIIATFVRSDRRLGIYPRIVRGGRFPHRRSCVIENNLFCAHSQSVNTSRKGCLNIRYVAVSPYSFYVNPHDDIQIIVQNRCIDAKRLLAPIVSSHCNRIIDRPDDIVPLLI